MQCFECLGCDSQGSGRRAAWPGSLFVSSTKHRQIKIAQYVEPLRRTKSMLKRDTTAVGRVDRLLRQFSSPHGSRQPRKHPGMFQESICAEDHVTLFERRHGKLILQHSHIGNMCIQREKTRVQCKHEKMVVRWLLTGNLQLICVHCCSSALSRGRVVRVQRKLRTWKIPEQTRSVKCSCRCVIQRRIGKRGVRIDEVLEGTLRRCRRHFELVHATS